MKFFLLLLSTTLLSNVFGQEIIPEQDPRYLMVQKVYKKMQGAVGDFRRDLPKLVLMERVSRVASYRSSDNSLIIECKALEVCKSMGNYAESALAFLIGHEMTHFYQEHDWDEMSFGTTFLVEKKIFRKHIHEEAEADIYGAFIAHIAGYKTLAIIPTFLDILDDAFVVDSESVDSDRLGWLTFLPI